MTGDEEAERFHDAGTESDDSADNEQFRQAVANDVQVDFAEDEIHQPGVQDFQEDEWSQDEDDFEDDFVDAQSHWSEDAMQPPHSLPPSVHESSDDELSDEEEWDRPRQLRPRQRVDYYQVQHGRQPRHRNNVNAMPRKRSGKRSTFDKKGVRHYNQRHKPPPPSTDILRRLTDQTEVLHRRNAASEQSAQRFIHSPPN